MKYLFIFFFSFFLITVHAYDEDPNICYCFEHCDCLKYCRSFEGLNYVLKTDHQNPSSITWHEYINGIFQAYTASTLWFPFSQRDRSMTREIGDYLIVRKSYSFIYDFVTHYASTYHSLSDYLHSIDNFKSIIDNEHKMDLYEQKIYFESSRQYESDKQYYAKEVERYNTRAKQAKQILNELTPKIISLYKQILLKCPHKTNPYNLCYSYNKGLIAFLEGDTQTTYENIYSFTSLLLDSHLEDKLRDDLYRFCGEACLEVNLYHQAIENFTKVLEKNPDDKKTYFSRASAYFETGQLDLALQDFLKSDKGSMISQSMVEPPTDFTTALINSLKEGMAEAVTEFVPSLCNSAYGLGKAIWSVNPLNSNSQENITNFAGACYEMGQAFVDHCKNIDENSFLMCLEQLRALYDGYDQLSESEKGQLIGFSIGRYGTDIFAGGAACKVVGVCRNLKNANRVLNLQALAADEATIAANALKHHAEREQYFKNVKLHKPSQDKHISGTKNFDNRKSVFEHPDPERLLSSYAGTGYKIQGELGQPEYREIIDFKTHIGIWKDKSGTEVLPTTIGTIHYSKKGAHIVPAHPNSKIYNKLKMENEK